MNITITPIPIAQTPGVYRTRYFVDVRFRGDNNVYDAGNFATEREAYRRQNELLTGRYRVMKEGYVPPLLGETIPD